MAADPELVKKYLAEIEHDRTSGLMTTPPDRLQPGNILGGKTAAFIEAVKQQGQQLQPQQGQATPGDPWQPALDEQARRQGVVNAIKGKGN